jgi:hypothetical protein
MKANSKTTQLSHPSPLTEGVTPDNVDREHLAQSLINLIKSEKKLSTRKNKFIRRHDHIRLDLYITKLEHQLFKALTVAVSMIAGQPVAGSLVQRLCLYMMADEIMAGLKNPEYVALVRKHLVDLRDETKAAQESAK